MNRLRGNTTATLFIMLVLASVALNIALVSAQKADAIVNGLVTETSEGPAKGSWRFVFKPGTHKLHIRIVEHTEDGVRQRCLETVGSWSGLWRPAGLFAHVAEMTQASRGEECTVYAFAWGDTKDFIVAILPDSTENKELFWSVFGLEQSEALALVMSVIATSENLIYGETKLADFNMF